MNFNIGIDIGSSNVRMTVRSRGVIFSESSAQAFRGEDNNLFAIGDGARSLLGRVPKSVSIVKPMSGGNVVKDEWMSRWLTYLFETAQSSEIVNRLSVLIAVDPMMQPSAAKHLIALALDAGAALCATIRSDFVAALGAGRTILKPEALIVLDIGDSAITCTLGCGGKAFRSESLPFGMSTVNDAILRILKNRHGLIISERGAEDIKTELCAVGPGRNEFKLDVVGFSPKAGFPVSVKLGAEEVSDATGMLCSLICEMVLSVVEAAPAELSEELNDVGIVMTGGGAALFGLDSFIAEKVGLPCFVAEDPASATIRGLTRIIERPNAYRNLIDDQVRRIERKLPVAIAKGSTNR